MSDLATYKATFKTNNKYLKYFCDNPASDWNLNHYKRHFSDKDPKKVKKAYLKNLQTVKEDSKNISSVVNEYIDELLKPFNSKSSPSGTPIASNITVMGNYYSAHGDIIFNNMTERVPKKQKTNHETKEVNFNQKWIEFLADAEQNRNFHRYSPERNGVTRLGARFSSHPSADKEVYRQLKKQLRPCETTEVWTEADIFISEITAGRDLGEFKNDVEAQSPVEGQKKNCQFIKDICKTMAKVYSKTPSISRTEAVYNTNMIFPCFEAMLEIIIKNEHAPYFVPGEDELSAMSLQLKKMGVKADKRKIYKADGVIHLAGNEDLEVLVLETASAFGHDDHAKISFDNSKGMFALLAMLKTVADIYKYASVEEFSKLKLYFVQPSGEQIRLWSMQYAKHGLYNFVREKKILVGEDFDKRSEHVTSLFNFFSILKSCLEETMAIISALKIQHDEKEKSYDSANNSQEVVLSDIICPKIFKLSFNTPGQHFANEHFKSSLESGY